MIVEKSVACSNDGFTVALGIPRQPETWRDVIVIARNTLDYAERFFRGCVNGRCRREQRRNFQVVANSIIQSEIAFYAPAVLREKRERQIVERLIGSADPLNISSGDAQTIGLQRSSSGER